MKNTGILIGGVLVIVIIILAIAFMPKGEDRPPRESRQDSDATETTDTTPQEAPKDQKSFDYILPADWENTTRAEKSIGGLTEGQVIEFGIVNDPSDETFAYFAASALDQDEKENLISIYRYNLEDYSFERLFRATYGEGDFSGLNDSAIPVLHVIGYDSGKLVILSQSADDSPGPCSEPILMGEDPEDGDRRIVSMNISDPYSGFDDYTPPDDVMNVARERAGTCLEELR